MTQQIRLLTYAVILIFVLLLGWLGVPNHHYGPRGLLLPTGVSFPAISADQVSIDANQALLANQTQVGVIHVETYAPNASKQKISATENYAMQLAAAHGANHILLQGIFQNPDDKTLNLYGTAVRR
jgi:hypothetical protein